jgi:SpoVK/Ycf46/Vps4 family AAA+-type ATPase
VLGLGSREADRSIRRALIRRGGAVRECVEDVFREKRQAVRKSGILEYCAPGLSGRDVGGLGALKHWFSRRRRAFSAQGGRFGLARAKGAVLVGVPGCGKSLSAKALAGDWNVPLLRLDMGRIYGSLMGQSEARLRQALFTAEAVSPCVLWIDELEKAFSGLGGGPSLNGGATQRVFGAFLGWLSDHRSPVFTVATANDVSRLPPEFLRAGRFDAVFFVDLPGPEERAEIFRIHLTRRHRNPAAFHIPALAAASDGISGAEIAESVVNGLYTAFENDCRTLATSDILAALAETTPLSRSRAADLARLRSWAARNARPASGAVVSTQTNAQ